MPKLIDTPDALDAAIATLQGSPWWGIDTEFLRERTYYPKLCLVQIATGNADFVIDAIALPDLSRLGEMLERDRKVKIVHAARQDLEALQRAGVTTLTDLFDTQTAASLLGHPDQVSYAWLVEHYFGLTLDKSQTRTDWTQRPLSAAQLSYALDDVRYLGTLYENLREALDASNKLAWLWEEAASLSEAMVNMEKPEEAWRRLRGLNSLEPESWSRGCELAIWRERVAQKLDIPRGWLLKDEHLFAIAGLDALSLSALNGVTGLSPSTIRRYGEEIIHLMETPSVERRTGCSPLNWRLSPEGTRLLGEFQDKVKQAAAAAQVAPGILASRKDLEGLLLGEPPGRLRCGWRAALIGDQLASQADALPLEDRRQLSRGTGRR